MTDLAFDPAAFHDLGLLAALPDGGMRQVEVGGTKLLLVRRGGRCFVVGGTCPHAGGPLAEGALHGDEVICPWHKAAFSIATGACTAPPALDDLPRYAVRIVDGRVMAARTPDPAAAPARPANEGGMGDGRVFAIVGSGGAGEAAAQELRALGFGGRVVMIGREDRLPYDRTLLSKYVLSGKRGGEKSPLQDAGYFAGHGIERVVGEVVSIEPDGKRIAFADGTELACDAVLVATGGTPRRPAVPGAGLAGVFVLRDADDAAAIVNASGSARRVVVMGGGFIGLEAAASLRERGLEVVVVMPGQVPLEKQVGAEVGRALQRLHEGNGVSFRLGANVVRFEGGDAVEQVVLDDGTRLPADMVVAGLGIAPATGMLRGVALREDGGIAVDATLRVSETLYAAGDVAAFPLRGGGGRVRVEHWRVAQQHGIHAARAMMGRGAAFDAVPVFWTIHYMKRLDYVGHAETWDEIVFDGDLGKPEFLAFYVTAGRVEAVAGFDRDRQVAAAIGLMTDRSDWTAPDLLAALPAA